MRGDNCTTLPSAQTPSDKLRERKNVSDDGLDELNELLSLNVTICFLRLDNTAIYALAFWTKSEQGIRIRCGDATGFKRQTVDIDHYR